MLAFTASRSYTKASLMRVYLPLTLSVLTSVRERQEVGPAPLVAYAVTPALREWHASDDLEELEYAALGAAARASLRLLVAQEEQRDGAGEQPEREVPEGGVGSSGRFEEPAEYRRVVVAVEVGETLVTGDPAGERSPETVGAVRLERPVPLSKVAAFHVDDVDAAHDVHAACVALTAGRRGRGGQGGQAEEDLHRLLVEVEEHELLWYATQELAYLP